MLNEALRLHHERSRCPDPSSLSPPNRGTNETSISRKFGKVNEVHTLKHNPMPRNDTEQLSPPAVANQTFKSVKFWIIALWAFCLFGFVAIMSVMLTGRRGQKKRGKIYKGKRRSSYSGFWDSNGQDRHLRNVEVS
jgi:peptidyl serine alpha-galactosyltransferase